MKDRQARHIGEFIQERNNRAGYSLAAVPNPEHGVIFRGSKILRLLLGVMLDVLATIGWFVTLPLITRDDRALTAREQSRG